MGTLTLLRHIDSAGNEDYVQVEYHNGNLRLQTVNWNITTAFSYHARVWVDGQLIYDSVHNFGSGSTNLPSNRQMVEETDEIGTYLRLPDGVETRIEQFRP